MKYFWVFIVSACSIALPATTWLSRWNRLPKQYLPFAVLFALGVVNEMTSWIMIRAYNSNMINSNVYRLVECLLLLWFFSRQPGNKPYSYRWAGVAAIVLWAADNLISHSLNQDNTYFKTAYYLFVVYISIDRVNWLLFAKLTEPGRRADLIIALVIFVSFSYQSFIEIIHILPLSMPEQLGNTLWVLLAVINLICNIIFSITVLWIPKQREYSLRL